MNKKTVKDIDVSGKRVLMRVDFNVPLDEAKNVLDDTRIVAAVPTIQHLLNAGASVVLMSHLGRPKGEAKPDFSLAPVIHVLSEKLGQDVKFADCCVGENTVAAAKALQPGEVLLLENLRFHAGEEGKTCTEEDQATFATELAKLGDVYVNDAFGTAHRAHASMAGVTDHFEDCVAGFLLEKEIEYIGKALENPEKPFVAIMGGKKVSDKIQVITALLPKVDKLIIGGAMSYVFSKAGGGQIGDSFCDDDDLPVAKQVMEQAGDKLVLPVDNVVADDFSESANTQIVAAGAIPDGWEGLDIGPASRMVFADIISTAKTVVWNGPMGVFEMEPFAGGTNAVAEAVAAADCISIIGGGDSVSAVKKSGLADRMSHISTGGGASLEFMEGKILPGIAALSDAEHDSP